MLENFSTLVTPRISSLCNGSLVEIFLKNSNFLHEKSLNNSNFLHEKPLNNSNFLQNPSTYAYTCAIFLYLMRYVSELRTFENKILRKIYGPVCERGIWRIRKNKEIRDLFNEPDIIANIRCRRMRWTGHVLRRGSESLIKRVWEGEIAGTRRRGRPKLRWKDQIKKDMEQINILEEEAQDRTVWRGKIGEAKSLLGFKWPWQ
uniref:Endonuclease-reverse transcriptase n=2 Tax=Cacopsylla melanoneura TaxID=428564 RepID=A0A8D8W071_9HEMI